MSSDSRHSPRAPLGPDGLPGRLLKLKELADFLGISERTAWRWLSAGKLPQPIRIGRAVRWQVRSVEHWIEAGCPQ